MTTIKKRRREHYLRNKKPIYVSHRKWVEKNREKFLQYHREYSARPEVQKRRRELYRLRIDHFKERDRLHYYKTKDRHRELSISKRFGISVEEYRALFVKFENKCGICKKTETAKNRVLAVDHDHTTGKIRGLLCAKCNKGLGFLKDDISLVYAIQEYLEHAKTS